MILRADARQICLADRSVHCVVTSPPYWGLRDYGVAGQIGLESTPDAYVASLLTVFAEVWRVLRDDGTLWLNIGDSYASGGSGGYSSKSTLGGFTNPATKGRQMAAQSLMRTPSDGLKPKDLVGIPWRVAFALQAAGWYLRSDIIWHKPNPMPESVTDRPTKAHEYLFLLVKQERYFYDGDAINEASAYGGTVTVGGPAKLARCVDGQKPSGNEKTTERMPNYLSRNKRSVWTIPTMAYAGAHFATMPEALVEPCIMAGCPMGGLVFDPFLGSGTVGAVAERLSRRWVGLDLTYQTLSAERTAQRGLQFADVAW